MDQWALPMDDMAALQSHMDDAAAHGPQDPGPGNPEHIQVIWMEMV